MHLAAPVTIGSRPWFRQSDMPLREPRLALAWGRHRFRRADLQSIASDRHAQDSRADRVVEAPIAAGGEFSPLSPLSTGRVLALF
jgi:hypothetical protein